MAIQNAKISVYIVPAKVSFSLIKTQSPVVAPDINRIIAFKKSKMIWHVV